MYKIYRATSPSGKSYIGMTRLNVSDRWDAHVTRARRGTKHPFSAAIRKYGKDAFVLGVLFETDSEDEAKEAEMRFITEHATQDRSKGYNISAGGDYDAFSGAAAMREKLKDPVFRSAYSANLKASAQKRDPRQWEKLTLSAAKWREQNKVAAYKNGRRAVRIATKYQNRPWTGVPGQVLGDYGRLWISSEKVALARRRYFSRRSATRTWASRGQDEIEKVSLAISQAKKKRYAADEKARDDVAVQLSEARKNVDRKKQAAAASKGQKAWWAELRKNPERYAEYMEKRRASLRATNEKKQNLRHSERGA